MKKISLDKRKKKYVTGSGVGCAAMVLAILVSFLVFAVVQNRSMLLVYILSAANLVLLGLYLFIFLRIKTKKK